MSTPVENMIAALDLEIEAIRRSSSSSVLELRAGIKQGTVGSDTLYSFPLAEEPNLRDDTPVTIIIGGKEIDGTIVSVRNGVLTVALVQDFGPQIAWARLVVNDSFLIERLRDRLGEIQRGEFVFNNERAEAVLANRSGPVSQIDIPNVVFTLGKPLNAQQKVAVRQSLGSGLLYLWGPPGTGKTSTLAAVVHALYLQGKSVLLVSNTNIAVDTALERIGDRLSTLPDFHEAAVLRFGPITSETLRAKYDAQVDLDRVVERHSAALVERQHTLKQEAAQAQERASWFEEALKHYQRLDASLRYLQHYEGQHRQLLSQIDNQQRALSSLYETERQTNANLQRAQSMGAIRKFFAGLNEDLLRRTLNETRRKIKNHQDSIRAASVQLKELEQRVAVETGAVEILRNGLKQYPEQAQCRTELEQHNRTLDQLAGEIKSIEAQIQLLRQELLGKCRVLATTVYQSYLKPEVARQFDVVIVDEASMLALPMVYYASGLAKEKVVVAGDFRQLPPIVMSDHELCKEWLKRDVFFSAGIADSVARKEYPPSLVALDEQFRMQEDICGVVNCLFYDNHLKTAAMVRTQKPTLRPFPETDKGLLYVDTSEWEPWAAFRLGTYSRYNVLHALLIRNIVARLKALGVLGPIGEVNDRLGIIAPYSAQCRLLAQLVGESLGVRGSLYAATVHRFQGNERDTVIYDLTDSIGARVSRFTTARTLEDDGARLLNVALSRARYSTLLIGNFKYLRDKLPYAAYLRRAIDHFERVGHRLDVSDCLPFKPEEIMDGHQGSTGATTYQISGKGLTVFTAGTFYPAFEGDCRDAEREIIIFSPFMTERGTGRWVELWRAKISEGVRVRLVVRPPGDQGGVLEHGLPELVDSLRKIGVVVDQRARMHEKLAFIDGKTLWHGSLNILSHRDTSESMLRVESPGACEQIGSFVVGRKWGGKEKVELTRGENPECSACGKAMVWKNGRYGIWFECVCGHKADEFGRPRKGKKSQSSAPEHQSPPIATGLGNCPDCGKPLKEKHGRFGVFVSCSGYPKCKYKPGKGQAAKAPTHAGSSPSAASSGKTLPPAKPASPPQRAPTPSTPTTAPVPKAVATPLSEATVTENERRLILQALEKAGEPAGISLLNVKSGISRARLKEIVPVLVQQGILEQQGDRYSQKSSA